MNGTCTPMADYQVRVVEEKKSLDEKISKLSSFIGSVKFGGIGIDEQNRMRNQEAAMMNYSNILSERIENFTN